MTDPTDTAAAYARLDAITAELEPIDDRSKDLRREATQIALGLLRAGEPPTVVAKRSPFTATHVRDIARKAGIPPARQGGGPKKARD